MKTLLKLLMLLVITTSCSQTKNFKSDIEKAHSVYTNAKDLKGNLEGLKAYEKLFNKYPNEWLPKFWAAYISSSIARIDADNKKTHLSKGMKYYQEAKKMGYDKYPSEFMALEGYVYSMHRLTSKDAEREEYKNLMEKAFQKSVLLDIDNPITQILEGMSISFNGMKDSKFRKVAAGRTLILSSKEKLTKYKDSIFLTPYFNYEMIDAFMPQIQGYLAKQKQ